jgi:hypothetical protein
VRIILKNEHFVLIGFETIPYQGRPGNQEFEVLKGVDVAEDILG